MKKNIAVFALALALTGSLAACSSRDPNTGSNTTGSAGNNSGTTSGAAGGSVSGTTGGSASGTPGTVSRRYGGQSVYNGRTYFEDGRYTAGSNGQVYGTDGSAAARDLTRDARDLVRDAGDAVGDIGRSIGSAAQDFTNSYPGTPSWEPDSSAVRY